MDNEYEYGNADSNPASPDGWIDPQDLAALAESVNLERQFAPEKTGAELAEAILESAAPQAAMSIVSLATKDPNSRVRLSASQYIIDRTLGKSGGDATKNAPWNDVFSAVTTTVDASTSTSTSKSTSDGS